MRFRMSPSMTDGHRRRQLTGLAVTVTLAAILFAVIAYRNHWRSASPVAPPGAELSTLPTEPLPTFDVAAVADAQPDGGIADARLDTSLLSTVHDDTLGIRRDEAEAFFAVFDHVRRVPAADLARAAREDVLHANLMNDPATFRGEAIAIAGELRRCREFVATPNEWSIGRLYEAWVHTRDSGVRPYRIVAANLDQDVPIGEARPIPVRVSGYFFKREGHEGPDGLRVAPMVLAQTISIDRSAPPPPMTSDSWSPGSFGAATAAGLILVTTFVSLAWSQRRVPRRPKMLPPASAAVLASLAPLDPRSVKQKQQLRALSERHRFAMVGHRHRQTRAR